MAISRAIPKWIPNRDRFGVATEREGARQFHPAATRRFLRVVGSVPGKGLLPSTTVTTIEDERNQRRRRRALPDFPTGTQVRRSFAGSDGVRQVVVGRVYDFQRPYWQVRYLNRDWEERSHNNVACGAEEHRNAAGQG